MMLFQTDGDSLWQNWKSMNKKGIHLQEKKKMILLNYIV